MCIIDKGFIRTNKISVTDFVSTSMSKNVHFCDYT